MLGIRNEVKMSELSGSEDVIDTRDADISYKKGIPAVPTPDWSIKNHESMVPTTHEMMNDTAPSSTESINYLSEMRKPLVLNTPSTCVGNSPETVIETALSATSCRGAVADIGSASSSLSRVIGDVPSTPIHSSSTPMYNSANPHSTMSAATPAQASGVNQAVNSIKLQNCVSTVNVGCELELLDIYCKTRYSEYNPQRFQGVVMKLMDPRATALIFKSGKIVCTGARNEYDSYIAARKFARIIERLGFPTKFQDFKIQNFCATADLKFPIRLEALQQAHGQFASYEPELFPGLVYRMVRPRVVLLIFVNGKIVFTGGKNRNEITEALEIIYPILRGYRIS